MPNDDNLTLLEKAKVKAHDYADEWHDRLGDLRTEEGISMHAILKHTYLQGYLDGFRLRLTGDE